MFTRSDVSCNLQAGTGSFDGSGDAAFGIKVYGQGNFTIRIFPRGNNSFQEGTLNVTVDAGPFV